MYTVQQPGEATRDFADRVRQASREAYPGAAAGDPSVEATIVSRFVCGLRDEQLRMRVLTKDPASLMEAMDVAAKFQQQQDALRAMRPPNESGSAFYSCDPPWLGHRSGITFRVDLPVATRRSDPPAVRREAALRAIAELPHPDVTIWSDGSARGGRNRAAQALIQFHHLNREETVRAPAGAVCSSLRAELTAMREAFAAVAGLEDGELASTKSVRLLTDSRSGLQLLGRGPANQTMALAAEVWRLLSAEHPHRERHRDGAPPIGDRRPAPANLPALCPELRARLAAEGIEQVFLVQVTVLPELLAAANAEGFSLPHLRYLVIDEADRVIEMAETGWLKAVERVAAATARRPASPAG
ncbi:hypothetical protein FJT64_006387 [Amphibalanus amphitrite]|uniref:Uncharacterized protein n=1 Tax=Amphibalanus amphitrite TaxID=1232801 RepID=A0A6A4VX34_AMPAM|nr:hypothetical protein FJT64_006387 [Amphibalanus amphitrite]